MNSHSNQTHKGHGCCLQLTAQTDKGEQYSSLKFNCNGCSTLFTEQSNMWCQTHNFDYCSSCASTYKLYHPHPLQMTLNTNKGPQYANMVFNCNGCKTLKSETSNYWCESCLYDLCSSCASSQETHHLI